MAPFGIARQVLSKADTVIQPALIFFAGASLASLRIFVHFRYLVFTSLYCFRAVVVLTLCAHALAMALHARFQAHAVLFLATTCASAMDLLDSNRR